MSERNRIVCQQRGLSDFDPEAFKHYVRLIIEISDLKAEDVYEFNLSQDELKEFTDLLREQTLLMLAERNNKLLEFKPVEYVYINGNKSLHICYKRQWLNHPPVWVNVYKLHNNAKLYSITISYRENESEKLKQELNHAINSFRMTKITDQMTTKSQGEKETSLIGWLIAYLTLRLIVTWAIGLAPPVILRYALIRRPISRKWAILFCVLQLLIHGIISRRPSLTPLLIALVSYYIVRKGSGNLSTF